MKALLIGFTKEEYDDDLKMIQGLLLPKLFFNFNHHEMDITQILMDEGPFHYVLMNIDDRDLHVERIYQTINDIIGSRPYLFIGTSLSQKSLLTDELLNDQKSNFVLSKPIVPIEFRKSIAQCEMWIKDQDFEDSILDASNDDMRSMRIKNFFLYEQLPYDVYLELTPGKFGKIISKNQFYSHQLIQSYAKKHVKFLYLKKDEHLKLLDTFIKNLLVVYRSKKIERSKLVKLHLKTIYFVREFLRALSVTQEINELVRLLSESIGQLVKTSKQSLIEILLEIDCENGIDFAESSLFTIYITEHLTKKLEWQSDMTRLRLVLAGILHDISLDNMELIKIFNLNDPLLNQFSEEDIISYKDHPFRAQEIARLFNGVTELDFIVKQHHEHPTGEGFPQQLNTSNLTSISCIFIIATQFVSHLSRHKDGLVNKKDILKQMNKIYYQGNFKDPMKALTKILEQDPTL